MKTIQMFMCPTRKKVLEDSGCSFVQPDAYTGETYTYTFSKEPFALSRIDMEGSTRVQNRCNIKINPEYVGRYTVALANKDEFPGTVLFEGEGKKSLIADGLHTTSAAMNLGVEFIEGVFFFSHPEPILVATKFNCRTTGYGVSDAEHVEKAAGDYIRHCDIAQARGEVVPTKKAWAAEFRISEEKFTRKLRHMELCKVLNAKNVDSSKITNAKTLDKIHQVLVRDQSAAVKIAETCVRFQPKGTEVEVLIENYLDAEKTSKEREAVFEEFKNSLQRATDNGKMSGKTRRPRGKNRSNEIRLKEMITEAADFCQKVDVSRVQKLLDDKAWSKKVTELAIFVGQVLDAQMANVA